MFWYKIDNTDDYSLRFVHSNNVRMTGSEKVKRKQKNALKLTS